MQEEHGTESGSTKYVIAIDGFKGCGFTSGHGGGGLCLVQL